MIKLKVRHLEDEAKSKALKKKMNPEAYSMHKFIKKNEHKKLKDIK